MTTAAHDPDRILLARWTARRDAEAFRELVLRHAGMVYNTCRRITRDTHRAEDLTQECFLRLARLDTERPGERLGAWLHRVATHLALDFQRAETRRTARDKTFAENRLDSQSDPWRTIEPFVDEAIAKLPEDLRAPLVAHFLNGQTHQAIADELGLSRRTVTNHIQRAIEDVRAALERKHIAIGAAALSAGLADRASAAVPQALHASLAKMAFVGHGAATASSFAALLSATSSKVVAATAAIALAGAVVYVAWTSSPESAFNDDTIEAASIATTSTLPPAAEAVETVQSESNGTTNASSAQESQPLKLASNTPAAAPAKHEYPFSAHFEGRVLDQRGEPVAGARVFALPRNATYQESYQAGVSAHVGVMGDYFLTNKSDSPEVVICAQAMGRRYKGQIVKLVPGENRIELDFALDDGVNLTGHVLNQDGSPAAGALILHRGFYGALGGGNGDYENFAIAGDDGAFYLGYREAGDAVLCVMYPGAGQAPFMMIPVSEVPVILQAPATAHLSGIVREANGSAAPNRTVQLEGAFVNTGSACRYQTETDANGAYWFEQVVPPASGEYIDYILRVASDSSEGRRLWVVEQSLGAILPGDRRVVDITIPVARIVSGVVTGDVTGRPLRQVRMYLTLAGKEIAETATDSGGRYDFAIPASGGYVVYPEQVGYTKADYAQVYGERVEFTREETKTADFVIPESVTVSINVRDATGSPVRATVDHMSQTAENGLSHWGTSETGDDGRFTCDFVTPGIETYFVVKREGLIDSQTTTWVGAPGEILPEEAITLYPSAGLAGVLLDKQGAAYVRADIRIRVRYLDQGAGLHRETVFPTTTDDAGAFGVARGVPATRISVSIESVDGAERTEPVDVRCSGGKVCNLGTLYGTADSE